MDSASDKYNQSPFKVQKRGVRIIKATSYLAHTQPIFRLFSVVFGSFVVIGCFRYS